VVVAGGGAVWNALMSDSDTGLLLFAALYRTSGSRYVEEIDRG
jgi:hypothetical protein